MWRKKREEEMQMYKKILVGLGLICMCLLALASSANAAGVGVSPASLSYEKVLKGGIAQEHFTLFNTADAEVHYTIRVEGEVSDWFSFSPTPPVKVPAKGSVRVNAIVNPPADIPTGVYKCTIYVEPGEVNVTEGEGAVMGILPAVGLVTSIEITGEQVLAGNVYQISVESNEIGKSVRFKIGFSNTGNVRANPEIDIEISKEEAAIDTLKKSEEVIPGAAKEITAEWTGDDLGAYNANVRVLLNGDLLSQRDLKFKVLERGALTCMGVVVDVKAPAEVNVSMPVKLEVGFKNTGVVAMEAKIKGDVIRNDKLVEVIESDPVLIEVGNTATLTTYFTPKKPGEYRIDSDVVYEGKKAEIRQVMVSVKSEAGGVKITESWVLVAVIAGLGVVVAVVLIYIVRRKSKKP